MPHHEVSKTKFIEFCKLCGIDYSSATCSVIKDLGSTLLVDFFHPQAPRLRVVSALIDESIFKALLSGTILLSEVLEKLWTQNFFDSKKKSLSTPPKIGDSLLQTLKGWPFHLVLPINCSCRAKIDLLDVYSFDECEQKIDDIVAELKVEADKRGYDRGLVFLDAAGKLFMRRVIRRAKIARRNFFWRLVDNV